jgi:hypothetical protein
MKIGVNVAFCGGMQFRPKRFLQRLSLMVMFNQRKTIRKGLTLSNWFWN